MTRTQVTRLARIVASIALFVIALYSAGLLNSTGWLAVAHAAANADPRYLGVSLLFIPLMDIVSTIKWKALTNARCMAVSFWRLFEFYIIGRFYNLILPSSIGGDLIRIHLLGRYSNRYADAAAIVFVERLTGVIMLIGLTVVALFFTGVGISKVSLTVVLAFSASAIGVLLWLLISPRSLQIAGKLVRNRTGIIHDIFLTFKKLHAAVHEFRSEKKALNVAIFNSFVFYLFAILNVWIAVRVFDGGVTLSSMLIAVPIIMFIMNIPISIGNIGIMEFGYTVVLMQLGVSGEAAIATALLMRIRLLIGGGVGGAIYALQSDAYPTRREMATIKNP